MWFSFITRRGCAFLSHSRSNKHQFSQKNQLLRAKKREKRRVHPPDLPLPHPPTSSSAAPLLSPILSLLACIACSPLCSQSRPLNAVFPQRGKGRGTWVFVCTTSNRLKLQSISPANTDPLQMERYLQEGVSVHRGDNSPALTEEVRRKADLKMVQNQKLSQIFYFNGTNLIF